MAGPAMLLDGLRTHAGRVPHHDDFAHAFIAIALLSLLSIEAFRRLAPMRVPRYRGMGSITNDPDGRFGTLQSFDNA